MNSISERREASPIERQFWLLDKQGKQKAYNIISAFSVRSGDSQYIFQVLKKVLTDYPIGQYRFFLDGGELIVSAIDKPFEVSCREFSDAGEQMENWFEEQCQDEFDLSTGPVLRLVKATSRSKNGDYIAIVAHHIAIDLRTKEQIGREIGLRLNDNQMDVEPVSNYQDFSVYLKDWIQSRKGEQARQYWQNEIASLADGQPMSIGLPQENSDPGFKESSVNTALLQRLDGYCMLQQTDRFIVLLSAYVFVISRYFLLKTVCVGVPLSNRFGEIFQNSLGCFVNTLPLVLQIEENATIEDVISAVRKKLLLANRYQAWPLVSMRSMMSSGASQLFSFGFTFEPPMEVRVGEERLRSINIYAGQAQLPVFLRCWPENDSLHLRLEYEPESINHSAAGHLLESYLRVIDQFISAENRAVTAIEYITSLDNAVIERANDTGRDYPALGDLKSLFENQVACSPDATALQCSGKSISYQQFNENCNQLAHYLIETFSPMGGEAIGLLCKRGELMMTALYGIIKSGAAYLPLDIDLPPERINTMLEQANVKTLLTESSVAVDRRLQCKNILQVDLVADTVANYPREDPGIELSLDQPAYVIFTSGSTGLPKGVVNDHRGIGNRLLWMQEQFCLQPGEVVLQKTPYSFDVSVWELFWPMQVGATLAVAEHNSHKDPYSLRQQILDYKVNVIHFVPAMLGGFLGTVDSLESQLRVVICSGEELTVELQNRFFKACSGVDLYNLYGPTEAAVDVTCWECKPLSNQQAVPIGFPVANTQIHIVDDNNQFVPVGVMGELFIAGVQVARGYINNPALTEERFIKNPFGEGKIYKTGDYARWGADGEIVYLGRKDFQVKINGVRIELAEIENALQGIEGVENCAVVVGQIGKNPKALIAYYSSVKDVPVPTSKVISRLLKESLPTYMVPTHFQLMDTMPLTSSGKLDRKLLPEIKLDNSLSKDPGKGPSSQTELIVYDAWGTVLGHQDFDLDSNFFDIGGDSLLLMQVFQILTAKVNKKMKSVDLFGFPTIRTLAEFLDTDLIKQESKRPGTQDRAKRMRAVFKR